MKKPEIAEVLVQIRDRKRKIEKLEFAIKDTLSGE